MSDRCKDCGRLMVSHLHGKCPSLGTHVVIDVDTVERARRTGHPRLLKNLLSGIGTPGVFAWVEIDSLTVGE